MIKSDFESRDLEKRDFEKERLYIESAIEGRPPPKRPYNSFGGSPPLGLAACGRLLPPWIPHVVWVMRLEKMNSESDHRHWLLYPGLVRGGKTRLLFTGPGAWGLGLGARNPGARGGLGAP
jgi:hypothetical protein